MKPLLAALIALAFTIPGVRSQLCMAESAIPLLSGFDAERIESVYPPTDEKAAGELAKLLYRMQKVAGDTLLSKVGTDAGLGDAVEIDGVILERGAIKVPERLHEFLEITQLQVLVCEIAGKQQRLVTINLPSTAKAGDRIQGVGVVIESNPDTRSVVALAAARLRWFPEQPASAGWKMLSEAGVDVSLLSDASSRNRRRLLPEDGDAFYSLLAAAAFYTDKPASAAETIQPVALLQSPENLSGQWISMNLETVQITRISVTEPNRQTQLGGDHYYQIDAMGDLGNIVVRIESPDGGEPASFENRYPVSIVTRELPDFLKRKIRLQENGDAVVANLKNLIRVDGFFYRLWSYSTDFMKQHGGGEQFGPLLMAAKFQDRQPTSSDPAGVGIIRWIAGIATICGILLTWTWNRQTSIRDKQIREQRKTRESEQLQLPE
ncbi:MAG: hypothetical protein AB8B91_10845 [Rubripirellula sp.]